jgi:2-polyprenyl-6-methoxyphenol hydroxylase-like FAD-dependent oxidoreductase
MTPSVTIVGGGLGGLTLARILHTRGIPATVCELEATPAARDQGGTLDLHAESGQRALAEAGLTAEFRAVVREEGEALRILDRHGAVRFEEGAGEGGGTRPEVDRGELKRILAGSLPEGVVRWGAKVTAVSPGKVTLATGDVLEADLVVGPGSMFALAEGKGLIAQRTGGGRIRVYAAVRTEDADAVTGLAERDRLLDVFAGFAPGLRALIADSEGPLIPRPIHALPVGHRWARVPGVTLLGDAAHVMSPFAGEGANLAMLDATELALALADHDDVESALSAYETAMFPRAEAAARDSADNLEACFAAGAPDAMVEQMTRFATQATQATQD